MPDGISGNLRLFFSLSFWEVMLESHLHKLILLNAGCCLLYLLGKILQELLLGPLREIEALKVRLLDPPPPPLTEEPRVSGWGAPYPSVGRASWCRRETPWSYALVTLNLNPKPVYCLKLKPTA
jgi:hypothetical protein